MHPSLSLRHFLLGLGVVAVWGTNFAVIKLALAQMPPLLFATLRFVAVILPAIFLVARPAVPWRNLASYGLLIGLGRVVTQEERANPARASALNILPQQEVVERVEAFMRRNIQQDLSRQELADLVHLSPAHLARIFQQATGRTLISRLLELRMGQAKQLLLNSTLSITEVSLQVGYRSFSHFSRAFKEMVGVSPSDYRRSGGNTWRKPV